MSATDRPAWSERLVSELDASDRRAEELARGLSREQLNWSSTPGTWSIGQCLGHLVVTNDVYLPAIAAALEGRRPSPVDQLAVGWFSRWFIRNYIAPSTKGTRSTAPRKIQPAMAFESAVLDAFLRSNVVARGLIVRAGDYDVNRIRFRNPLVPGVRFTVGTGLEIVSKHESRHLLQAERVRRSAGFPQR